MGIRVPAFSVLLEIGPCIHCPLGSIGLLGGGELAGRVRTGLEVRAGREARPSRAKGHSLAPQPSAESKLYPQGVSHAALNPCNYRCAWDVLDFAGAIRALRRIYRR